SNYATRYHKLSLICIFCFIETATTEIYTLSLHDALPISIACSMESISASAWPSATPGFRRAITCRKCEDRCSQAPGGSARGTQRSEEHTSELQSRFDLVCRLLLEKKKLLPHKMIRIKMRK